MRLASAKFILPFFFVINPALILRGTSVGEEIWMIGTCFLGLMLISAALEGYLWIMGRVGLAGRLALFASGFLISIPTVVSDYYGLGLGGFTLLILWVTKGNGKKGVGRVESI
jgi:TRAP-type uncharacterized transport system fused permease subunit